MWGRSREREDLHRALLGLVATVDRVLGVVQTVVVAKLMQSQGGAGGVDWAGILKGLFDGHNKPAGGASGGEPPSLAR